jgi:stromal membrane-associated protein
MGTHISRVKSVDLDAWTDEQLQSVLKWGNSRANKYWEAKLAPGHVPSEAKIENFIRTKYESKRWVMEGPMPDPSTLDAEGDDDVPLSLVKEKHNIERSTSQRASSGQPAGPSPGPSHVRRAPQQDLFGDDGPPPRANSAAPVATRPPPKAEPAPPKQTKPADSLLGLDFFGTEAPAPNRPASAAATPGVQSRPDLKQSILSLYASAPRPQPQQQPSHASQGSFGGMQSPPPQQQPQTSFGGMNDAFSGLSFSNPSSPPVQAQPKQSAFSNLGNISSHGRTPSQVTSPANLGGGSFFDSKPAQKSPPPQPSRGFSSSSGFGAFDSAPGMSPVKASNTTSSGLGDLFDFSAPSSQPSAPPKQTIASPPMTSPVAQHSSVFNLSQPVPLPKPQAPVASTSDWSNSDAWGSNDAWSTAKTSPTVHKAPPPQTSSGAFGWGSGGNSLANQSIVPGGGGGFTAASNKAPPKVSADEDFGGWSSAAPVTPGASTSTTQPKPATGFAASEDLFSNVWE